MNGYRIEKSKDNLDILIINDRYINSRFNPSSEANSVVYEGRNLICIFGLGFGYGLNNILKNNKESIIVVFEPVEEILTLYKKEYFSKTPFKEREILFLDKLDKEEIYSFIENTNFFSEGRIYYYSNIGYKSLFPSLENEFYSTIKESFNIITQNKLTESNFIPVWTKNFIFNSLKFSDSPILKPVKIDLTDNLALIACAGPNLIKDIPIIKEKREKLTIFAVDTAIKPLIKNDIFPDFVVSLDGQFYSFEDFTKYSSDETIYIFDLFSYPQAARLSKNVFFTPTKNILSESIIEFFFTKNGIENFGITTGGTVSDYAFNFALNLGFKNVYFSGLDLSFPYLSTHSKYSPYHERILNNQNYFETPETSMIKAISKRKIKDSKSKVESKNLISDFVLENYGLYISNYVRINDLQNIYNSSSLGLEIEGLKNVNLKLLLDDYPSSRRIKGKTLIEKSKLFYFSKDSSAFFYDESLNELYNFSLLLKNILDNTDFEKEDEESVKKFRGIYEANLKKFPFLKKFILMTKIILDKKSIRDSSIIYYKHIFYKLIQSVYFTIRTIQKFKKIAV